MSFDPISYVVNNAKTNSVASGFDHAIRTGDNTFSIFFIDGSKVDLLIPIPKDGISIIGVEQPDDEHFVCLFSDGTKSDPVKIPVIADAKKIPYTNTKLTNVKDVKGALDAIVSQPNASVLSEALTATQAIGSVTSGKVYAKGTNLESIIRDILVKEEAPTVTLTLNPSKVLYDVVEETLSTIVLTATVTKKTYPPTKVTYYVDDVVVNERTITDGGTFSYTYNFASATNKNHTFKVAVTDGKLSSNATKTIKFVGNSYYGTVASDIGAPTEAQIKGLSKTLKDLKGYTYAGITMDFGKVVYAYPKDFGALTSIKDPVNNYDYTNTFSRTAISVDGIDYYCYTQTDPSAADNVKLTFA